MVGDSLQRFLFLNHDVKSARACMPAAVKAIMQQHHYPAPVARALGECLVAVVLLTHSIKFRGDITLQLESGGAIQMLVAKCSHDFAVRGLATFDQIADADQLATDFSQGRLVITIQQEGSVRPMQSIVELQGQRVATALEYYFLQSEQLPTAMRICVDANQATGVLLQRLPQPQPDNEAWRDLVNTLMQAEDSVLSQPAEAMIKQVFGQEDIELYPALPVRFECHCSLSKMREAVKTLGEQDALDLLAEKQVISVVCEYCNTEYTFTRTDVEDIFSEDSAQ